MQSLLPTLWSENELASAGLLVVLAPHAASGTLLSLAALLAGRGPVQVLDGGNRFNAYPVARAVRRQGAENFTTALERIRVARAFTCYQMAALLEATPAGPVPTLVIDLLDTFYDQSAPVRERRRLLDGCVAHLQRLSRAGPVVASLRPPRPPLTDPAGFVQLVQAAAGRVWLQEELAPVVQPRLF